MAWRKQPEDPFPEPLREFRESEWPPVAGECLGHYGCDYGSGYTADCCPRPGEYCGQLHYEMLARDYPDRPELLARARAADAFTRYHQARCGWLGPDHPLWPEEFFFGDRSHEIRYGRPPGARLKDDDTA